MYNSNILNNIYNKKLLDLTTDRLKEIHEKGHYIVINNNELEYFMDELGIGIIDITNNKYYETLDNNSIFILDLKDRKLDKLNAHVYIHPEDTVYLYSDVSNSNCHALVVDDKNKCIIHLEYNDKNNLQREFSTEEYANSSMIVPYINNHVPNIYVFNDKTGKKYYIHDILSDLYINNKGIYSRNSMMKIVKKKKYSGIVPDNLIDYYTGNNFEYNTAKKHEEFIKKMNK